MGFLSQRKSDTSPSFSRSFQASYGTVGASSTESLGPEKKDLASDMAAVRAYILGNKSNVLLILIPFGAVAGPLGWGDTAIFLLNFLAILPLAQLLGDITEELALYFNDTIGGLINATFGNATELILSIFAIQRGLLRVVQVSLLGSVLSNQLLVTGCCFLFGGLYHREQHFSAHIAAIDSSLLLMAVLGLTIPAAFSATMKSDCAVPCRVDSIITISHATALLLFFLYGMLLLFQLVTHTHIMDGDNGVDQRRIEEEGEEESSKPSKLHVTFSHHSSANEDEGERDEQSEEDATLSQRAAIIFLLVVTFFVSWCSELLVGSIEAFAASFQLTETFIAMTLIPVIGNAAEHASSVSVAMKGKMDLALGVALGSSIQIALCVVPALCLVGWIVDSPLTLDFHLFETVVLVVSVLVVSSTVSMGTSTWLEGIMLIISYFIISIAYYYRIEPPGETPSCACGEPCCFL